MAKDNLLKRAARAQSRSLGALNLFRNAAKELEAATDEHYAVANTAYAKAQELDQVGDEHRKLEDQARSAATKLREIVGGGE